MQRTLQVTIDHATWPLNDIAFPHTFHRGTQQFDVNILGLLLAIGYITTPSHASRVSLSEFWAWVRYLHAVSNDRDLRLTRAFAEMDAHQKMILSDDFGMGVPICWLYDRLQLSSITHGRYFTDRVAATVGATTTHSTKKGPSKSPDFVAKDALGQWHVIECKGTQSGITYRNSQLGNPGPPPEGGVAQKRTITFPPEHTGQRLACGLSIGVEGGNNVSNLRIIDPPAESSFVVEENHIPYATDAISRSAGGRALRLAGFSAASSFISAPSGAMPSSQPTTGQAESVRQTIVNQKTALAREELENRQQRETFEITGESYRGQSIEILLPKPDGLSGRPVETVYLRHGVNDNFLNELASRPLVDEPLMETYVSWRQMIGKTMIESESSSARMTMGSLFFTEIRLMS